MSEFRFTDGNLIVLYGLSARGADENGLRDHVKERVKVGLETYSAVIRSKPDGNKTMFIVVADPATGELVKKSLIGGGVPSDIIAVDSDSADTPQIIDSIREMIKSKPNPPFIYFVGPYWLQDVYRSTAQSHLKDYKSQFYGAIDHRPYPELEEEKSRDAPKKGGDYYKQKLKNKAVDVLLNVIFPD